MSSPATLPITNPSSTDPTTTSPFTTPAFRAFLHRLTTSLRHTFSQRRPFSELLDRSAFTRPDTLPEALSRIRKNSSYFRVNYLLLLTFVLAFSLLSHPFSLLLLLSLLCAWSFCYFFRPSDQPLSLFGRNFSDREILGILVVSSIIVIFLTSVGSLLISAVLIGLAIVCTHGAFRVPEDLFLMIKILIILILVCCRSSVVLLLPLLPLLATTLFLGEFEFFANFDDDCRELHMYVYNIGRSARAVITRGHLAALISRIYNGSGRKYQLVERTIPHTQCNLKMLARHSPLFVL